MYRLPDGMPTRRDESIIRRKSLRCRPASINGYLIPPNNTVPVPSYLSLSTVSVSISISTVYRSWTQFSLSVRSLCCSQMAVVSANAAKTETSRSMDSSPSARLSDAASESAFSGGLLSPPADPASSSPNPPTDLQIQPQASQRSEEYRQLFRLPPDEKVIPFHEVTSVRRAKAAGIFPTAIEVMAGGKKYFFTSFLSRDEAFKLINDGWSQHGNGAKEIADSQTTNLGFNSLENGDVTESTKRHQHTVDESDSSIRQEDIPVDEDPEIPQGPEGEIVSSSGVQNNELEDQEAVVINDTPSSGKSLAWVEENSEAPKVPDFFAKVAETKFPIRAEEFFNFFFSDDAVGFLESYHKSCGNKDFRCSSWYRHDKFGHARDVSFQHPLKIYFGAKYGGCQEVQKFRVYRNSHFVIETSHQVSDVPYGDYFRVEGFWDIKRDGDESEDSCVVCIYVNVAFSKKTMWKGKIVQTTVEEARDANAIWMKTAHELLKQKNLEKEEEMQAKTGDTLEGSQVESAPDSMGVNQLVGDPLQGTSNGATSLASLFRESMVKFYSSLKSQSQVPLLLVIAFALILLLMQLSIVVLLSRPQQVQLIPQADYMGTTSSSSQQIPETMAWLEKRIHHLNDEMLTIETILEKMRQEHTFLKAQLKDLQHFRRQRR